MSVAVVATKPNLLLPATAADRMTATEVIARNKKFVMDFYNVTVEWRKSQLAYLITAECRVGDTEEWMLASYVDGDVSHNFDLLDEVSRCMAESFNEHSEQHGHKADTELLKTSIHKRLALIHEDCYG